MNPSIDFALEAWREAVGRIEGKTPKATKLTSAEWEREPLAIRERAIWSARLADAQAIQGLKDDLRSLVAMEKVEGRTMDRSRVIERMRKRLGALPGDSDKLTDITSFKRLELVVDFQTQDAYGHAQWKGDLEDPDMLWAEPAWRFVRLEPRENERLDWPLRWVEAYADVGGKGALKSPMVALKTSPIWSALSRFGRPWPPFDFGSGMGVLGVGRDEAIDLGLIKDDTDLDGDAAIKDFNDEVEASVKNLDPETRQWLQNAVGNLGQIVGDKLKMVPQAGNAQAQGINGILKAAGISSQQDIGISEAESIIQGLKKANPPQFSSVVSSLTGSQKKGTLSKAFIVNTAQDFLNLLPASVASQLPKFSIQVKSSIKKAAGDYHASTKKLRLNASALQDPSFARKTIFHELIHWLHDHGPQDYRTKVSALFAARTAGEASQPLLPWKSAHIMGKRDKWQDADGDEYAGRIYPWEKTPAGSELATCHLEKLTDPASLSKHWNHSIDGRHYWREAFLELIDILTQ